MTMEIDDLYIDTDFRKWKSHYVPGDLGRRAFDTFADFEASSPVLSDREIDAAITAIEAAGGGAERLVTRIYSQGQEGSCVANATSQSHEVVQAKQFGKENVIHLSAISLYKRIGRSPGSGANVSDGLDEMVKRGILPLDTPENRARFGVHVMPNTGFYEKYPQEWESTARMFCGVEYTVIRTLQGMKTALVKQQPVVVGRQGHSICYVGLIRKNGRLLAPYPNSWSLNWGSPFGDMKAGFGFDSERQIGMSAQWAFTLRSVTAPPILPAHN